MDHPGREPWRDADRTTRVRWCRAGALNHRLMARNPSGSPGRKTLAPRVRGAVHFPSVTGGLRCAATLRLPFGNPPGCALSFGPIRRWHRWPQMKEDWSQSQKHFLPVPINCLRHCHLARFLQGIDVSDGCPVVMSDPSTSILS